MIENKNSICAHIKIKGHGRCLQKGKHIWLNRSTDQSQSKLGYPNEIIFISSLSFKQRKAQHAMTLSSTQESFESSTTGFGVRSM